MRNLLLLVMSAALSIAAGQNIIGGPFAVNVTPRSATVVWIVQGDQATLRPAAGGAAKTESALRAEKTTFTGLQPGTRYDYAVAGQDAGKGSFVTPPAATSTAPYHFIVYGDTRTRHDVHRSVVQAILKHGTPDFVVQSGDMVENGYDNALWPIFFDIERELLRHTAFFPVLGNHERNSKDFYSFFQVESPYYSFDWGSSHFVMINSDVANVSASPTVQQAFWSEQTRWMEEDLAKSQKAEFRFVVAHHPPFTAVAHRQDDNLHMKALVPMFEKYHVSAGLFGHDHNYQHYLKNGIHYVGSGGGGAPLYDVDDPPKGITVKVMSTENFVAVNVDGKVAHFETFTPDGQKIDEFEIKGSSQK